MKKTVSIALLIFFAGTLILTSASAVAVKSASDSFTDFATYNELENFVAGNPKREAGTEGETNAAKYLQERMKSFGFNVTSQPFEFTYGSTQLESANLIVKKQSAHADAKNVIIGAHYDAVIDGDGVLDNGSGVAALIVIASKIANLNLPFHVTIVFFGAEEAGLIGSKYYASEMTIAEKNNTMIMLNLDCVMAGDEVYLYTEDVTTKYEKFLLSNNFTEYGVSIKSLPLHKRAILNFKGLTDAPYYHTGQASDNSSFRVEGIPTAFYLAGNLSSKTFGYVETEEHGNNMHTPNDVLNYYKDTFGIGFVYQMETVVNSVISALVSSDFIAKISDARNQLVPGWAVNIVYPVVLMLILLLLFGFFCYRYHRKLVKQVLINGNNSPIKEVKTIKPADTDIFTYRK